MAIEIKFKCSRVGSDYLTVNHLNDNVWIEGEVNDQEIELVFDVPTAIKFSKTLQAKIREIKEVEHV